MIKTKSTLSSLLIFSFLFLAASPAHAWIVSECGEYDVQGYFDIVAGRGQLVLNEGTETAMTIKLGTVDPSRYRHQVRTNIEARIEFTARCNFDCVGELVAIRSSLDPFENPRHFGRRSRLVSSTSCR